MLSSRFAVAWCSALAMLADGTRVHVAYNEWDEAVETVAYQKPNAASDPLVEMARSRSAYTEQGRVRMQVEQIDTTGRSRATGFTWEQGDAITTNRIGEIGFDDAAFDASTAVRVAQTTRDTAGRVVSEIIGEANGPTELVSAANTFAEMRVTEYFGDLACKTELREPRAARKTQIETEYDGLGRPIETAKAAERS